MLKDEKMKQLGGGAFALAAFVGAYFPQMQPAVTALVGVGAWLFGWSAPQAGSGGQR